MDAIIEAAKRQQILATTHSPDLLDHPKVESANLLSVDNSDGTTEISPIDEAAKSLLQEKLATPGELLRRNQLQPDRSRIRPKLAEGDLFERIGG
jgi:hypothetical protein